MIAMLKDWFGLIAIIIAVATTVYAWVTRRSKENAASIQKMADEISGRLKAIEKRLIVDDRRIQRLENDFQHLPTREQISELKVALAQVSTTVENTNKMVERMDNDIRSIKKGGK